MKAASEVLTSDAYYWIIQRSDGVGLATSSHDLPHEKDGIAYEPIPAFQPQRLLQTDDIVGSKLEMSGALSSAGLTAADLDAGRWSSANVVLGGGSWDNDAPPHILCKGTLGGVQAAEQQFVAEVSLEPDKLREQPCPQTSPECRAQLGDRDCRICLRERRLRTVVAEVRGNEIFLVVGDTARFGFGQARWLSGSNAGLARTIVDARDGSIWLREGLPFQINVGDRLMITEGCDGRLETCSERFGNVANFRGEPHLPGTDLLLRYPGV